MKKRAIFSPPPCPFRFVGLGEKTLFVASMGQAHLFFPETLQINLFNSILLYHLHGLSLRKIIPPLSGKNMNVLVFVKNVKKISLILD